MPSIRYRILNVFAETPFGGNPLAVIEDGSGLSDAEMQAVARQFNLSETTFLFPSERAAARVRIFTPTYEMPFAGHPTLGSAQVVRELFKTGDSFTLEMQAGLIPVRADGDRWTLRANPPDYRAMEATRAELAAMLNLPEEAIAAPAMWVNCGTEQPMIPLTSVDHVNACRPDSALMKKYNTNTQGQAKTYVFARTADGFESRYFWISGQAGLGEDPGTGSACANLGGWWMAAEGDEPLKATVRQGTLINRPNLLTLEVTDGEIHVGGRVIELGGGELHW
ncbi:MAG TPA: PhzF family phenazine biosynthesis protein [Noviherbaspirillum sp.]|uniref:PhzF family phenazine biosynthesis protein n=1 Tax=Noviherbaspirillum sp. TaxID=1926288 RepID=UPI002B49FA50|nr:PhzF family phenazine biosynthesis protein [Noviherbaspirillum sp.]HJV86749.1 PhzF family phenazine biosynthesis protein [Noviherbaspirillum sp.]